MTALATPSKCAAVRSSSPPVSIRSWAFSPSWISFLARVIPQKVLAARLGHHSLAHHKLRSSPLASSLNGHRLRSLHRPRHNNSLLTGHSPQPRRARLFRRNRQLHRAHHKLSLGSRHQASSSRRPKHHRHNNSSNRPRLNSSPPRLRRTIRTHRQPVWRGGAPVSRTSRGANRHRTRTKPTPTGVRHTMRKSHYRPTRGTKSHRV